MECGQPAVPPLLRNYRIYHYPEHHPNPVWKNVIMLQLCCFESNRVDKVVIKMNLWLDLRTILAIGVQTSKRPILGWTGLPSITTCGPSSTTTTSKPTLTSKHHHNLMLTCVFDIIIITIVCLYFEHAMPKVGYDHRLESESKSS